MSKPTEEEIWSAKRLLTLNKYCLVHFDKMQRDQSKVPDYWFCMSCRNEDYMKTFQPIADAIALLKGINGNERAKS